MRRRGAAATALGLASLLLYPSPGAAQEGQREGTRPPDTEAAPAGEGAAEAGDAPTAGANPGTGGGPGVGAQILVRLLSGGESSRAAEQADPADPGLRIEPAEEELELKTLVGGALRFNLFAKTWRKPTTIRATGDNVAFDTFRLNVESTYGPVRLSAEYRFYAGYNMLHHGFIGYRLEGITEVQLGVVRVPFGLLPYASNNWFFNLGYYLGLEDDYDLGMRADFDLGMVDFQIAYFRNDEGSYAGSSIDSTRFSYDVVRTDETEIPALAGVGPRRSEERDQLNLRMTFTGAHGDSGSTEVGLSGQIGRLDSDIPDDDGYHWAAAAHLKGQYGRVGVMAQVARHLYEPATTTGQDERWMAMGAYDAPYRMASEAYLFVANVSYRLPIERGPFQSITFYEDFSYMLKDIAGYADSKQITTGTLLHAGPIYAYLDVVIGHHHPWIGPVYVDALAEGGDGSWDARFNANLGYYF